MTNFLDFCCFETLFPQLVAGPIVRYADIAEQLRERSHTPAKFARGIAFFSLGLAKKVLIANPLAHIADGSFDAASRSALEAWLGLFAYSFQLYFDFSGYSDMAVGLGLMFGFVFIKNFDAPYQAQSITEFWRRWHISLSTWLRDYLYIPLGGNRQGTARTYFNLLTVMLLGGFWHGASWNFLIWGGIHGGMLALERALAIGQQRSPSAWIGALRNTATFVIVSLAWVFFRADDLPSAIAYLGSLVGLSDSAAGSAILSAVLFTPYHTSMLILAALIVWLAPQTWEFTHRITTVRAAACLIVLVLSVMLMWTQTDNPFLYFQF
jgi:alginate O-acetyltransferase complex protein AlgI